MSSKDFSPPSRGRPMTDDVVLVEVADTALAARLDDEIAAFNFDATGIRDAREFAATVHERGELVAGVQG
jgi:hypothetical protein